MSPLRMYVYGASGHGKVVADILRAAGFTVAGFVDDSPKRIGELVLGLPVAADSKLLHRGSDRDETGIAMGIGDNRARQVVAERCRSWGFEIISAVHPSAVLSPSARIGAGTVVMPQAIINADATLGTCAIVNTGAVVEHDCSIGDYAHLSPNATLGGGARIGTFSQVGLGAVVLPGVSIGSRSIVGAGAVVLRDIPDDVIAVGVPARIHAGVSRAFSLQT